MAASAEPITKVVTGVVARLSAPGGRSEAPASPPEPMAMGPTDPATALLEASSRAVRCEGPKEGRVWLI